MPAPAYPLPARLSPLHLYRHVLREASYLPPAFRTHFDSAIRKAFRGNRNPGMHAKKRLSRAHSVLKKLRAANSGDKKAMENLVMEGFGRKGARRRELVAQIVRPQGPSDRKSLEAMLDQAPPTSEQASSDAVQLDSAAPEDHLAEGAKKRPHANAFFEKWDQPKLLHLLESQREQQKKTQGSASWPARMLKGSDADQFVPQLNIWGKPPSDVLVRAKRAHWWRRNASKMMPPLGKGEWELLQRLGAGAQDSGEWARPLRRAYPAPSSTLPGEASISSWDWTRDAGLPTAAAERDKGVRQRRRTGQIDDGPFGGRPRRDDFSDRWFRRLYNRIWQLTPHMRQHPNTLEYEVSWGKTAPKLPNATGAQLRIFEGLDAGALRKAHQKRD